MTDDLIPTLTNMTLSLLLGIKRTLYRQTKSSTESGEFGQLVSAQKGAHSIALYTILFDKNCSQQIL